MCVFPIAINARARARAALLTKCSSQSPRTPCSGTLLRNASIVRLQTRVVRARRHGWLCIGQSALPSRTLVVHASSSLARASMPRGWKPTAVNTQPTDRQTDSELCRLGATPLAPVDTRQRVASTSLTVHDWSFIVNEWGERELRRSSVARSLGRSVARSLGRSVARSLGRSVARSLGRSVARSLGRSVVVTGVGARRLRHPVVVGGAVEVTTTTTGR